MTISPQALYQRRRRSMETPVTFFLDKEAKLEMDACAEHAGISRQAWLQAAVSEKATRESTNVNTNRKTAIVMGCLGIAIFGILTFSALRQPSAQAAGWKAGMEVRVAGAAAVTNSAWSPRIGGPMILTATRDGTLADGTLVHSGDRIIIRADDMPLVSEWP